MGQGAQGAAAGLGTAAAAVQAIPVGGQIIGAALGLGALMAKMFGARKDKKKEKQRAQQAFMQRHRQGMMGGTQQSQARPGGQEAPETQGMGQFQQMQAGGGPIYQSGGEQPQQNTGVNYG